MQSFIVDLLLRFLWSATEPFKEIIYNLIKEFKKERIIDESKETNFSSEENNEGSRTRLEYVECSS